MQRSSITKEFKEFLQYLFGEAVPKLPTPREVDEERRRRGIQVSPGDPHWVEVDQGVFSPRPFEVLRILTQLKQRFGADKEGRPLVGDYRVELRDRVRPKYSVPQESLKGDLADVGGIGGYRKWSSFQVEGWGKVLSILRGATLLGPGPDKEAEKRNLVIVAPTGTGKSEVFLLPLLYEAKKYEEQKNRRRTFVLVYPRVALLRDQLSRALRYAAQADAVVGFQFKGVGAKDVYTLKNRDIFDDDTFRVVKCPKCAGVLRRGNSRGRSMEEHILLLRCEKGHEYRVTLSREGHVRVRPHLLLTTVESLENLYLHYESEGFFQQGLHGVVLDEAHLYESLYGAHVSQLLKRIRDRSEYSLPALAVSATIAAPEDFGTKLLGGPVEVFAYDQERHGGEVSGLEVVYFLSQHSEQKDAGSLLIQTLMALGHAVLRKEELTLVFNDSRDGVYRYQQYLEDAERERGLFTFRTHREKITYKEHQCPGTAPAECPIYHEGECWRGLFGYLACRGEITDLRQEPMRVGTYTSLEGGEVILTDYDVILATSSLEVGVDEEAVNSVVQYGPPRNAASFAQRRGRAGRRHGRIAYNLVVLGQEPADRFVLTHRGRLLDGQVEPPLNPNNPVVRELHEYLEEERKGILRERNNRGGYPLSALKWLVEKLRGCSEAREVLGQDWLDSLGDIDESRRRSSQSRNYRDHIVGQLRNRVQNRLEEYAYALEFAGELDLLVEDYPARFQREAEEAKEALKRVLDGRDTVDRLREKLNNLHQAITQYLSNWDRISEDERQELLDTMKNLYKLYDEVKKRLHNQRQGSFEDLQRRYHFLSELKQWLDSGFALISPPEDLRAVLRALFFLHQGLPQEREGSCSSRPPALVPRAYFEYTAPLIMRRPTPRERGPQENETEPPQSLEIFFPPYRLQYRYGMGKFAYALRLRNNRKRREDSGLTVIEVEALAKGIRLPDGSLQVQTADLQPLETPGQGRPIVRFCKECGRIYGYREPKEGSCSCGANLINLIYARLFPRVLTKSVFEPRNPKPISRSLLVSGEEGGRASVKVLGSLVEGTRYSYREGQWIPLNDEPIVFKALYQTPLAYELRQTHGVGWRLEGVLPIREEVEWESLFHSAASLLRRAVAGVTGVNPDLLRASVDRDKKMVWVWELVEGGGGITQLFRQAILENPLAVYREMLRIVACPVYLAEARLLGQPNPAPLDLLDSGVLVSLKEEVTKDVDHEVARLQAERDKLASLGKNWEPLCQREDGCPACVREPFSAKDEELPRRSLAERLVRSLVQEVEFSQLADLRAQSLEQGVPPPFVIEVRGDKYKVLVL